MRICLAVLSGILLSCASVDTLLREERADAKTVAKALSSQDPERRCLAARACAWRPHEGCDELLEAMALHDEAAGVRLCAIDVLAERCSPGSREALHTLSSSPALRPSGRLRLREAAQRCPSADLVLALVEANDAVGDFAPPPDEWEARLRWAEQLHALPAPKHRAGAELERARREVHRERSEADRFARGQALRDLAEREFAAGRLDSALEAAEEAAGLGIDVAPLLRHLHAARLRQKEHVYRRALDRRDYQAFAAFETPGWDILHPEARAAFNQIVYERLLDSAREIYALGKRGEEEAASLRIDAIPPALRGPILDLRTLSQRKALLLLDQERFDEAWSEAWLLRSGHFYPDERFLPAYARLRWEKEGLTMSPQALASYIQQVGDHAPADAQFQATALTLKLMVQAGNHEAAPKLLDTLVFLTVRNIGFCLGEAKEHLGAKIGAMRIDEVADALEWAAMRVTSDRQRRSLRSKRDEGQALTRRFREVTPPLSTLQAIRARCDAPLRRMELFQGSRAGSEAHAAFRSATEEILGCAAQLEEHLMKARDQGARCVQYMRGAAELLGETFEAWR